MSHSITCLLKHVDHAWSDIEWGFVDHDSGLSIPRMISDDLEFFMKISLSPESGWFSMVLRVVSFDLLNSALHFIADRGLHVSTMEQKGNGHVLLIRSEWHGQSPEQDITKFSLLVSDLVGL